jgi:hypothetical protein
VPQDQEAKPAVFVATNQSGASYGGRCKEREDQCMCIIKMGPPE